MKNLKKIIYENKRVNVQLRKNTFKFLISPIHEKNRQPLDYPIYKIVLKLLNINV